MTDLVKLILQAGEGGNGRVSFRREKYVPKGGPDGGNGGNGGSIFLEATLDKNTLDHLVGKKRIVAENGQVGGKKLQTGKEGDDTVIQLPVGTVVWLLAENAISHQHRQYSHLNPQKKKYYLEKEGQHVPLVSEESKQVTVVPSDESSSDNKEHSAKETYELIEASRDVLKETDFQQIRKKKLLVLDEPGKKVMICRGGNGGKGNKRYASASHQYPLEAEYGEPGEIKAVVFELQLLADIGLVGFPNAGKSTFLSRVTKARPKVGQYPFTTLEPHLGRLSYSDGSGFVLADIPGLIEGAQQGKGLGYAFLRHISHCRVLLFLLFLEEDVLFCDSKNDVEKAALLWKQFQVLQNELYSYDASLRDKEFLVAVNKIDIYSEKLKRSIKDFFGKKGESVFLMSLVSNEGVDQLKQAIRKLA